MARGDKLIDILQAEITRLGSIANKLEKNQLIDFAARVNSNAKQLEELNKLLKERIQKQYGLGSFSGQRASVTVSWRERQTISISSLRENNVDERLWGPFVKTSSYYDCSFKVK